MPLWTLVDRDHTRQVCEKCKQLHECVVVVCVCACVGGPGGGGGGGSNVLVINLLFCGLSQNMGQHLHCTCNEDLGYSKVTSILATHFSHEIPY